MSSAPKAYIDSHELLSGNFRETPTMNFRWVEYNSVHMNKSRTPVFEGEILGHHYGETGYILQQLWLIGDEKYEWRNIEIEYNP